LPGVGGLEGVMIESAEAEIVASVTEAGSRKGSERVPPSESVLWCSAMSRESDSSISNIAFCVDELRREGIGFDLTEVEG
jgi:hypothetical protein